MSLVNALETLLEESYNAFLLTIQCNTVAIYCTTDGKYKIFRDIYIRDSCGMIHPQGTCVLLELQTLNSLLNYIQTLYRYTNAQFELKNVSKYPRYRLSYRYFSILLKNNLIIMKLSIV